MIIQRRVKLRLATIAVALIAGCGAVLFTMQPNVKSALSVRGIPSIPSDAKVIKLYMGGVFTKQLFLVVSLRHSDLLVYESRLSGESLRSFRLDEDSPQAHIIASDAPSSQLLMSFIERNIEVSFKDKLNGVYPPWWDIEKIRRGTLYEKDSPDSSKYRIYTDHDRNLLYIVWNKSPDWLNRR